MNSAEEVGNFILKLRKEKNLTQYELADLIPISRMAISKWERGINYPDSSCLFRLSEIFGVTINELLYGERINEKNEKNISDVTLEILEDRDKKKKILIIVFIILILTLLIFFSYYFFNTFNSVKVYTLNYTDDNIPINNGILLTTKEKTYFYLGDVSSTEKIESLKLYYKYKNQEKLICLTDSTNINLYDYYGYNLYFNFKNLKNILENMYLDIKYNNMIVTIKLNFIKDFSNSKLMLDTKKKSNSKYQEKDYNISSIEEKILNTFQLDNEKNYTYLDKDGIFYVYFEDAKTIVITDEKKNELKEWYYNISTNYVEYSEYNNGNLINSFIYDNGNYICNYENCNNKNNIDKIKYFQKKLDSIR